MSGEENKMTTIQAAKTLKFMRKQIKDTWAKRKARWGFFKENKREANRFELVARTLANVD